METKANYLMIGGFVLGVLALAFIFIYWMSNFGGGGQRYTIVFDGSVAGLTSGSSVAFNGIRVGEVQSFALDPADARKVQVHVTLRDDTPIRENSRASIQSMGLTGGSGIQITPGTPDSPLLVATADNPWGPWTKDPRGKVFEGGHLAVFDTPRGGLWFSHRGEHGTPERGRLFVTPFTVGEDGSVTPGSLKK